MPSPVSPTRATHATRAHPSTIPFPFPIPLAKAGAVVRHAAYGRRPPRPRGEPPGPQRRRRHGRRSGRRAPPPPPAQGVLPGRQVSHPQRSPASFLCFFFSARASTSSTFIISKFPTILPRCSGWFVPQARVQVGRARAGDHGDRGAWRARAHGRPGRFPRRHGLHWPHRFAHALIILFSFPRYYIRSLRPVLTCSTKLRKKKINKNRLRPETFQPTMLCTCLLGVNLMN